MKAFLFFMALLVILALVAPFFLQVNGKAIMTVEDDLPDPTALVPKPEQAVYRWQDADGVWHFSESPPTSGDAERITLRPNIDAMPATSLAPAAASTADNDPPPAPASPVRTDLIPGIGGLLQGKALMQEAQEQADALEARGAHLDAALQDLQKR